MKAVMLVVGEGEIWAISQEISPLQNFLYSSCLKVFVMKSSKARDESKRVCVNRDENFPFTLRVSPTWYALIIQG